MIQAIKSLEPNYKIVSRDPCSLGEGIALSNCGDFLAWVDINNHSIFVKTLSSGEIRQLDLITSPSKVLSVDKIGILILHQAGISEITLADSKESRLLSLNLEKDMRTNDGYLMGNGDVIYSTMGIIEQNHRGKIWFWDRIYKPVSIIENLSIPNMPIVLEAESTILFADSESGSIFSAQYSSFTERLSEIKELNHLESSWGVPDGSFLDNTGSIWNCRWGAGLLLQFSISGQLLSTIQLPVQFPTSCVLDVKRNRIYVTSANPKNEIGSLSGHTLSIQLAEAPPSIDSNILSSDVT